MFISTPLSKPCLLEKAFTKIPDNTNLILHSDQGWQYQHKHYQKMLKEKGIRQSMSRKGNCLDNACAENFFGLLKTELLYLQENGFDTIWFEDLSHIEDYEKPVILTFDDGYDDNYTELFPLLQKYNAKATIFVIPKAIGTPHKMTAEQIYELSRSGLVSIQSHTYSHGNLSTMDEQTLIFEMEESQKYLAALTGQVPYAVCYPEGTRSELSIEVAGRYYDYGLLMNGQLYNTSDDPLRVKRFYVPRGYDLGSFRWSVQEAGTW